MGEGRAVTDRTLRGQVARRNNEVSETAAIEADIRKAREWFDTVAPAHLDAGQFVNLCLSQVRRGSVELKKACIAAPWSFMEAASECARLGLVPGETYHFVAFFNGKEKHHEIVGIVDYKGEIDQIYRAGGVRAVHFEVVRARDTFIWRPNQMPLPHHIIHAPEPDPELAGKLEPEVLKAMKQQEGLAGDAERGPLTGVYAYAEMADGGFSQPVVMSASTVKKHRDVSKTDKFWGPPWPNEGPWTPDMWLKTAVHKLFDRVPHSAEYLAERLRAAASVVEQPPPAVAAKVERPAVAGPVVEVTPEPPPGPPEGHQDEPPPPADEPGDPPPDRRASRMGKLHAMFREHGLGGKEHEGARRAVCTGLIAGDQPAEYVRLSGIQTEVLDITIMALQRFVDEEPGTASARLREYADQITQAVEGQPRSSELRRVPSARRVPLLPLRPGTDGRGASELPSPAHPGVRPGHARQRDHALRVREQPAGPRRADVLPRVGPPERAGRPRAGVDHLKARPTPARPGAGKPLGPRHRVPDPRGSVQEGGTRCRALTAPARSGSTSHRSPSTCGSR